MGVMESFVAGYSQQFKNFNEDVLINIRKNDDLVKYIDETWVEVAKCIPNEFKYLGYTFDDNGSVYKEINKGDNKKKGFTVKKSISTSDTYARMAVFKFRLSAMDNRIKKIVHRDVSVPILIPMYIDDYHFYIKGNKYSAPYQLTDAITYTNRTDTVVLKTMTRPIKMTKVKKTIKDVHGNTYNTHTFNIYMTAKKVPFLLYYFAHFGLINTIKYFGADSLIKFYDEAPLEPSENQIFFKFGTLFCGVSRKDFENNYILRQFIATMLDVQKRNMDASAITNVTRWIMILGNTISGSATNTIEKNEAFLRTFITSLDHRTVINIQKQVGGFPKESMFSVVRWMFFDFNILLAKNNGLSNKRIRVGEYLVTPLIKTVYQKLYRFLGTSERYKTIERCADILKISSGIIVGAISGKNRSKALSLNIAKYSAYVNDDSVINVATKFTKSGPGSPMEKSGKMISNEFRLFDPSYVGKVCLTDTSNSEPGISGVLVPTAQIDLDTLTFKEKDF